MNLCYKNCSKLRRKKDDFLNHGLIDLLSIKNHVINFVLSYNLFCANHKQFNSLRFLILSRD